MGDQQMAQLLLQSSMNVNGGGNNIKCDQNVNDLNHAIIDNLFNNGHDLMNIHNMMTALNNVNANNNTQSIPSLQKALLEIQNGQNINCQNSNSFHANLP